MTFSGKVIFITFATEGPPHDTGLPIAGQCFGPLLDAVKKSGVDEIIAASPRILEDLIGKEKAVRTMRKLPAHRNQASSFYTNSGNGDWKSKLIEYTYNNVAKEGDIVIYHDANWKKYPCILKSFAPRAREFAISAAKVTQRTGVFSLPHVFMQNTVTRGVCERLRDQTQTLLRIVDLGKKPAARARCISIIKRPDTVEFVKKFSEACDDDENLTGGNEALLPNGGWPSPGFNHNMGEQAILNALLYGMGIWKPSPEGPDKWITENKNIGLDHNDYAQRLISWSQRV